MYGCPGGTYGAVTIHRSRGRADDTHRAPADRDRLSGPQAVSRHRHALIEIVAAVLILAPTVAGAADLSTASPAGDLIPGAGLRMVGGPAAAPLRVLDAAASGDDLVYLGRRSGRQVAFHRIEAASGADERLATVRMGDFDYAVEALGDGVVFTGRSMRDGVEPWVSHGTAASTRLLRDIARGRQPDHCASGTACGRHAAVDSDPGPFATIGDIAYFSAADPSMAESCGARMALGLAPDSSPTSHRAHRAALTCARSRRSMACSISSLTTVATVRDSGAATVPGRVRGWSPTWARAGRCRGGTRRSRPVMTSTSRPGTRKQGSSYGAPTAQPRARSWSRTSALAPKRPSPRTWSPWGIDLYFTANDGEHGRELWRTDGSADGTILVKDIEPGREGSLLGDFVALGDGLYFAAWGRPGLEYRSDGTEAGTTPFSAVSAGPH